MKRCCTWSMIDSSGCPTARSGHCVTVAKDEMYMFGGCGLPGNKKGEQQHQDGAEGEEEVLPICLGDLHVYNVARQRWKEVVFPAGTPRPAQRTCAALCASEEEDRLFLSGGAGDDPYDLRGDLLQYDVRSKRWSVLYDGGAASGGAGSETCPFRRIGHTMVHHSASNRLVLFGGSTGLDYFDDVHAFDLATGSWALLATTGDRPSPRYKHQAFVDADFMYVVGGGSYEPEGPDLDVYRLALAEGGGGATTMRWERLTPVGTPPRCRAAHGLAWDRVGRTAYIWGGFTSGMELDSTFCALRLPPSPVDTLPVELTSASAPPEVTAYPSEAAAAVPAATAPAAVGAAPAAVGELGESTEAVDGGGGNQLARGVFRRSLSVDSAEVPAAAVPLARATIDNKPSDRVRDVRRDRRRHRASASGIELPEQQQWQHQLLEQQQQQQQQQQVWLRREQESPQLEQQEEQPPQEHRSPSPPPLSSDAEGLTNSPGGRDGRERWRQRGQRLWRQGSVVGREDGGGSRSRRPRGGRRRTWGQGWATVRLQGLWGGAGAGATGGAAGTVAQDTSNGSPPPPSPLPFPPSSPPRPVATVADAQQQGAAPPAPPATPPDAGPSTENAAAAAAAAAVAECGELSWVSLPSGQGTSSAARDAGAPPSSPAGRSFHCVFFQGGACYVTGGSDGARKFGDMWRFSARESPPPLTTLAARVFVSTSRDTAAAATTMTEARKGGGGGGGGEGNGEGAMSHEALLERLPEELRRALINLNMQAEVVL